MVFAMSQRPLVLNEEEQKILKEPFHPRFSSSKGTDTLLTTDGHCGEFLCQLIDRERSVNDIAELLGARQSTVSQHLSLLRKDGFVQARREGQTQFYSLKGEDARSVIETLHALYCVPASRKK